MSRFYILLERKIDKTKSHHEWAWGYNIESLRWNYGALFVENNSEKCTQNSNNLNWRKIRHKRRFIRNSKPFRINTSTASKSSSFHCIEENVLKQKLQFGLKHSSNTSVLPKTVYISNQPTFMSNNSVIEVKCILCVTLFFHILFIFVVVFCPENFMFHIWAIFPPWLFKGHIEFYPKWEYIHWYFLNNVIFANYTGKWIEI